MDNFTFIILYRWFNESPFKVVLYHSTTLKRRQICGMSRTERIWVLESAGHWHQSLGLRIYKAPQKKWVYNHPINTDHLQPPEIPPSYLHTGALKNMIHNIAMVICQLSPALWVIKSQCRMTLPCRSCSQNSLARHSKSSRYSACSAVNSKGCSQRLGASKGNLGVRLARSLALKHTGHKQAGMWTRPNCLWTSQPGGGSGS